MMEAVSVPATKKNVKVEDIRSVKASETAERPLISTSISAGFPSPALDTMDAAIDLNRHLVRHPSSTYFGRVKGESMKDAGINDGDLLVIDKSIQAATGKIAVCFIDGEFTLKRVRFEKNACWLDPANDEYRPIKITEDSDASIWGIVTFVIKAF